MKKIIFAIITTVISYVIQAQITPYSTPIQTEYKPLNLERFAQPLAQKQAMYNQNYEYLQNLVSWINTIKSKVNEVTLNSHLDEYSKILKIYEKKDLSVLFKELKQIEVGISEEINQYNKRINEKNDPNKYWQAGNDAFQVRNLSLAIENYGMVIKLDPTYLWAYYQRGISYFQLGNYSNAISDLTIFIEKDKSNYESFLYRGWAFSQISNNENALLDMNKCIELNSTNAYAYYSRGHVLSELQQYEKAIEDYKMAIKLQPDFSMAYNNIAWVKFLQKQYSQALVYADQAVKLENTNSVAIDTRAEIKFNLNDYKGCIEDANSALLLDPKITNCYLLKGRSFYRLGKKTEACVEWQIAVDMGNIDALDYLSQYCK
jgi:tetratricopeptide (TPR) repeat protein